ncbi:unnamed protein product [Moneuplotes crassus]|uniref:Uncharacterized protein n=1 Tax=Euplotes crassus TaxID=5936 RepID=A0AAD1XIJ5_EUPCR|nr:unnamed protein product [Moneuplotes crassus]
MKDKTRIRPNFRKRLMKKHLIKADYYEDDGTEITPPKEDGRVHVNWADDLEKIYDFEESKDTLVTKKTMTCEKRKSILKKTKFFDPNELSETECSSTASESTKIKKLNSSSCLSTIAKPIEKIEPNQMKKLSSYNYKNKKLLSEILYSKKRLGSCFTSSKCKILEENVFKGLKSPTV